MTKGVHAHCPECSALTPCFEFHGRLVYDTHTRPFVAEDFHPSQRVTVEGRDICSIGASQPKSVEPGWVWDGETWIQLPLKPGAPYLDPDLHRKILEAAISHISGERSHIYGDAADDFARTARLWSVVLGIPVIETWQVAICLAMVKVSRLCQTPNHQDSWEDGCGYFALGGRLAINEILKRVHGVED